MTSYIYKKIITLVSIFFVVSFVEVYAETVSGNGYIVEQTIAPINGSLSGNGFIVTQASQEQGGIQSGGGYNVFGVFGASTVATPPPSSGGGGGGGGGGYFIYPIVQTTTTPLTQGVATGTGQVSTTTQQVLVTNNGSSCKSRIVFSGPIDVGSVMNKKEDVEKLEIFLNTYENENLPVNGIYETRDVNAVKRWQKKYKSYILDPMRLKNPTGTVYTLSQRQIERQTTKKCGEKIEIICPYFKTYMKYGDRNIEVKKIQQFLNIVQGEKVNVNGVFGPMTREAVKRFQRAYKKDIVSIVTLSFISGNWNVSTRTKANEVLGCDILQ